MQMFLANELCRGILLSSFFILVCNFSSSLFPPYPSLPCSPLLIHLSLSVSLPPSLLPPPPSLDTTSTDLVSHDSLH